MSGFEYQNTRFHESFSNDNLTTGVQVGSGELSVGLISVTNPDSSNIAWLQLFNNDGVPTLGTDITHQILIPANGSVFIKANSPVNPIFHSFDSGFGLGAATAKNGATQVSSGLVVFVEYN